MPTILLHKPYGYLSQFTGASARWRTLADLGRIPSDVYPAGRLDADSEGLLLLTDDAHVAHRLTDPKFGHERAYWAQVEGVPDGVAIAALAAGIVMDGRRTRPAGVRIVPEPEGLPPRDPPVRIRRNIPTAWIELVLHEGKNRQVRRMTAAVGHPTLRLMRWRIGPLTIEGLGPGAWRALADHETLALERVLGDRPRHRRRGGDWKK